MSFAFYWWQVQDDLQYLRAAFARANEGEVDSKAVELALKRTERGLQVACERVENSGSENVLTLPAVKRGTVVSGSEAAASSSRNQRNKSMQELMSVARRRSPIKQHTMKQAPIAPNSFSPGQHVQAQHISQLMSQPSHPLTQQLLSSHYGLPVATTMPIVGVRTRSDRGSWSLGPPLSTSLYYQKPTEGMHRYVCMYDDRI